MKELLPAILEYIKVILIVLVVISIVLIIISMVFDFVISLVFFYAAMISFILGFLSVSGSMKAAGNPHYMRVESTSSRSLHEHARENMRLRDSSYGFLIFMTILGVLLVIISNVLGRLNF